MPIKRVVPAVAAMLVVACAGAEAPVEYPDAVTVDPDHYTVQFENDAVRILRIAYGAGETSVMHRHPPHCVIFLNGGAATMESPDGEVTEMAPSPRGTVICAEGAVHLPTNTSTDGSEAILVEFNEGAMAGSDEMPDAPHASEADPDHYSIEFENDVVRLVRVNYGPGETSNMHHHPAYCPVNIQQQPVTFELPDGTVVDPPEAEPGTLSCVDAEMHVPTNNGEGDLEAVLIELKGTASIGT